MRGEDLILVLLFTFEKRVPVGSRHLDRHLLEWSCSPILIVIKALRSHIRRLLFYVLWVAGILELRYLIMGGLPIERVTAIREYWRVCLGGILISIGILACLSGERRNIFWSYIQFLLKDIIQCFLFKVSWKYFIFLNLCS